jgi:hypothetical protein
VDDQALQLFAVTPASVSLVSLQGNPRSDYIHTIVHLEPSYVIQKFLDAQRMYNHMTLLLNCYTKLKDVEKLNIFTTMG